MKVKKQDPTVKLSDRTCIHCTKSGVVLKSDDHEFSAPMCPDHMMIQLRKWHVEEKEAAKPKENPTTNGKADTNDKEENAPEKSKESNGAVHAKSS